MGASSSRRWTKATVVDAADVAEAIRRIVLRPEASGAPAPPGSHVDVGVRIRGLSDVRSYSVVGMADDGQSLVLGVQLARESKGGSAYMHSLPVGGQVSVSQPLQNFPLTYGRSDYLLLAGGIGITALVAMASSLRARGANYRFVYGARSRKLMAFADDLAAEHGDRFEMRVDDEGTRLDVQELVESCGPDTQLYVCGPIGMLDAVRHVWATAGRPLNNLRFETFGSSGRFAPERFDVEIPQLGMKVSVPADVSMLEALEEAGADMMFDCRKGECGLCEAKVLDVTGAIDHRDVFLSEGQHEEGDRILTCVSRVVCPRTVEPTADQTTGAISIAIP
jgi:ferredoxin-NADP reductase